MADSKAPRGYANDALDARTAMELFDLAADILSRVRGPATVQRRAERIGKQCIVARNLQLDFMEAALDGMFPGVPSGVAGR